MNESQNNTIQVLNIIFEFLSNNMMWFVIIILIVICRKAISDFISRVTTFSLKQGDSSVGMEAATPLYCKENTEKITNADDKPTSEDAEKHIDRVEVTKDNWFFNMHNAFDKKEFDEAEKIFNNYASEENDIIKFEENQAIYYFLKFEKANDDNSINKLQNLAENAKSEESKYKIIKWLSLCFNKNMLYQKETKLWQSTLEETESSSLKIKIISNISNSLCNEEKYNNAKTIVVDNLPNAKDDKQKSILYEALSKAEKYLGNKSISIYCKDKSLEYDTNNRDELFKAAYAASDENITDISISNYIKLIRIEEDNDIALNNLGVKAQETDLKTKAVENFKKSSEYNNTLAMANQGYLLLDAGFTNEAENIAHKALEFGNTHQNIHKLIASINEKKEEENKKWNELIEKSLNRQKLIRKYTEQYYLGNPNSLKGQWKVNNTNYSTTIVLKEDLLEARWIERTGEKSYNIKISGTVTGSTFKGKYTKKINDTETSYATMLMVGNLEQSFIGFIDENQIKLISTKLNDNFSLNLTKA